MATVRPPAAQDQRPRRARKLRTGWQGPIWRQHSPEGSGPDAHGPPLVSGLVQVHLSPTLAGLHSPVVWHTPLASGPNWQPLPSQARPQPHFWFGRW
jgi:hypothetical protein